MARYRGRYSDFLSALTEASARINARNGLELPSKPSGWLRYAIEFPINVAGVALGHALNILPAGAHFHFYRFMFKNVIGESKLKLSPDWEDSIARAARLKGILEERCERRAAVLGVMSHPPTEPEAIDLNVELLDASFEGIGRLLGGSARIRAVTAVDAFALDALGLGSESVYAAAMNASHIGVDRMPDARPWFQREALLPKASVYRTVYRLLHLLRGGGATVLAASGGVPGSGRLLYSLREGLWRLRRFSRATSDPERFLERLREDESFMAFEGECEDPEGARSAWRLTEAWLLDWINRKLLMEDGKLDEEALRRFDAAARAFDLSPEHATACRERFMEEFSREVPFRERLFSILLDRLKRERRPVLLFPVRHGDWRSPVAESMGPVAIFPDGRPGEVVFRHGGSPEEERRSSLGDFVRDWGLENFQ